MASGAGRTANIHSIGPTARYLSLKSSIGPFQVADSLGLLTPCKLHVLSHKQVAPMSDFKVIIIGAGPTGLTAAHALSKAGIDFVVLERRPELYEDVGASLVLFPYSLRVMAQLGLLEKLREIGHEVLRWADFTTDFGQFMDSSHTHAIREKLVSSWVDVVDEDLLTENAQPRFLWIHVPSSRAYQSHL